MVSTNKRLTLKQVNAAIAAEGGQEYVVRRGNYFWFTGGNTGSWFSCTADVTRVSDWTLEMWLQAWREKRDYDRPASPYFTG